MSNSPGNKEQGKLVKLTPTQSNPGAAKPEDFEVNRGDLDLPSHGQHGRSRSEEARLIREGLASLGKSQPGPTPDRNHVESSR